VIDPRKPSADMRRRIAERIKKTYRVGHWPRDDAWAQDVTEVFFRLRPRPLASYSSAPDTRALLDAALQALRAQKKWLRPVLPWLAPPRRYVLIEAAEKPMEELLADLPHRRPGRRPSERRFAAIALADGLSYSLKAAGRTASITSRYGPGIRTIVELLRMLKLIDDKMKWPEAAVEKLFERERKAGRMTPEGRMTSEDT
jgi:hypothetical protein